MIAVQFEIVLRLVLVAMSRHRVTDGREMQSVEWKTFMIEMETTAWVLAADEPAEGAAKKGGAEGISSMLIPFAMIALVWYFLLLRPQRREASKRADLLNELKKNDRVVTYGGMLGTVAAISQDGREVTLKVDDNTRIRFLKSAIQTVLRDETTETPAVPEK